MGFVAERGTPMTVCENSLSGICGACEHLNACRNSELEKVPMTNEEWFASLTTEEKAVVLIDIANDVAKYTFGETISDEDLILLRGFYFEGLKEVHQ